MSQPVEHHNGSFWFDSLGEFQPPASPESLPGRLEVAIVGAGFTGLWTAYYLKRHQPELTIGVFEAHHVGFGASGRNGGWCMGTAAGIRAMLDNPKWREAGMQLERAMQDTVDEVGRVCQAENIDCHFAKGGTLTIARYPHEVSGMRARVEQLHAMGFTEQDFSWLEANEAKHRLAAVPNLGALYTSHCAAIHPARLVRGLAERVQNLGGTLYENTPVHRIEPGRLVTGRGEVSATRILRATEGYTTSITGQSKTLLPLYSMMIATEPLDESLWHAVGLHKRETFDDGRHVTIYGQRTLDNRLAFGGCVDYYFGAKRSPVIPPDHPNFAKVEASMKAMLPMLKRVEITHRWGGLLGVPRKGRPFVQFDPKTGLGAAGGYTGEGVGASNLAGRILADQVLGRDTPLTQLAWTSEVPGTWPIEPLPWLGSHAARLLGNAADLIEAKTKRPTKLFAKMFAQ